MAFKLLWKNGYMPVFISSYRSAIMLLHQLICQIYSSLMPIVIYKQPDRSQQNNPQLMCLVWIITSVVPFQCKKHFGEYQCTCKFNHNQTFQYLHLFTDSAWHRQYSPLNPNCRDHAETRKMLLANTNQRRNGFFDFISFFLFQNVAANENMAAQSGGSRERKRESSIHHQVSHHLLWHAIFTWPETACSDSQIHNYHFDPKSLKRKGKKVNSLFHSLPFP